MPTNPIPTEAVLPCPFCGDTACVEMFSIYTVVLCSNCNCQSPMIKNVAAAIAAWNTRTVLPVSQPSEGEVDAFARFWFDIGAGSVVGQIVGQGGKMPSWFSDDWCRTQFRLAPENYEGSLEQDEPTLRAAMQPTPLVGWLPIESAPKDGTRIIVGWLKDGQVRGISGARWVTADHWAELENGDPDDFEAGWCEPNYNDELCANVWMPLPAPPADLLSRLEGGE